MPLPPNIPKIFGLSDKPVALLSMCAMSVQIALVRLWAIALNLVILVAPLVAVMLRINVSPALLRAATCSLTVLVVHVGLILLLIIRSAMPVGLTLLLSLIN